MGFKARSPGRESAHRRHRRLRAASATGPWGELHQKVLDTDLGDDAELVPILKEARRLVSGDKAVRYPAEKDERAASTEVLCMINEPLRDYQKRHNLTGLDDLPNHLDAIDE